MVFFFFRFGFFFLSKRKGGKSQSFSENKLGKTFILFSLQLEAHRNKPRDHKQGSTNSI